jgi:hypothetical protein
MQNDQLSAKSPVDVNNTLLFHKYWKETFQLEDLLVLTQPFGYVFSSAV